MKLYVYHTPDEVPDDAAPDCAVAIDVLRATSTVAAAFDAGAAAVEVFDDLDRLKDRSDAWPAADRVCAGERGGVRIDGFDLGNSPLEMTPDRVAGRRLFMSTTNGTRCFERVAGITAVVAAALVNRHAVVRYLADAGFGDVWLVASGWRGTYSLEDTACAGAIVDGLARGGGAIPAELAGNDAATAAVSLYRQWQGRPEALLRAANHGRRLLRLGCADDLAWCARLDTLDVLPVQTAPGVLERA